MSKPMPPDEWASVRALKAHRRVENIEKGIVKPDGNTTWLTVTAEPVPLENGGVVVTYSDVSERRRAEDLLRQSEEKYRNLFENVIHEIHFRQLVRDENGMINTWRLVDANPAALRSWGKTRSEVVGKTTNEIFAGYDAAAHFMPIVQKILFEPFFTTKRLGKGTGLGLATICGIVKQNNGFINVSSEPGNGATFRIFLPRRSETKRPAQTKVQSETAPCGKETILLVEDQPSILEITKKMLERLGYAVISADAPKAAINLAKSYPTTIHLLITDVVMPEMNGRDLAEKLALRYPDIKCLFMSGYTADVIAHRGVLNEGIYFIQKPFSKNELAVKVREALEAG